MFSTTIASIPCQIDVTYFDPGEPECLYGHPDSWHPGTGAEIEFEVFDRRGYRAEWLERKITDAIRSEIEEQCIEHLQDDY